MRAVIGDCSFEAEGDPDHQNRMYGLWIEGVRKHFRRPIEERVLQLESELREQRRILKKFDAEWQAA